MNDTISKVMLGHAVGNELGVTVEFCERNELTEDPVTDVWLRHIRRPCRILAGKHKNVVGNRKPPRR